MKQYIKKEGKEKNAASETEKDRNRYPKISSNFGSCASAKNMFNYINSFSRKYALCVANLIVTRSYDSQKSVQEGKW